MRPASPIHRIARAATGRGARATGAAALLIGLALASCVAGPPTRAPVLEPAADSPVWPAPPERARYAFAGVLLGERDFLAPGHETASNMRSAVRWLVGLVVGEPDYIELRRPVSGLTDESGRILVVDASHRAVVVFDMAEQRLRLWRDAANGLAFAAPVAIVADGAGGYLVTDAELAEVFRLGADGAPLGRFGKGILTRPTGIAYDPLSGQTYVADTGRHDLKVFEADGTLADVLGTRGGEPGQFNAPTHLLFHGERLYVVDSLNFRVQVLDRDGGGRFAFGRLGPFVGEMSRPKGIAVGGGERIYVVESYFDHLLVFDAEGQLLLPIGGTGQGIGEFYLPAGVWTDRQRRVYVADMFNGRVVVLKELTDVTGS